MSRNTKTQRGTAIPRVVLCLITSLVPAWFHAQDPGMLLSAEQLRSHQGFVPGPLP